MHLCVQTALLSLQTLTRYLGSVLGLCISPHLKWPVVIRHHSLHYLQCLPNTIPILIITSGNHISIWMIPPIGKQGSKWNQIYHRGQWKQASAFSIRSVGLRCRKKITSFLTLALAGGGGCRCDMDATPPWGFFAMNPELWSGSC